MLFGRFVTGASREGFAAGYNVPQVEPPPFAVAVLLLSPPIAGKIRGTTR
jgi:hypothetical protein